LPSAVTPAISPRTVSRTVSFSGISESVFWEDFLSRNKGIDIALPALRTLRQEIEGFISILSALVDMDVAMLRH
jgi:hypothetical protein